ncbi:MAG TPA: DUF3631 domain-containing protein [Acidobacteriota bacterium]|nr:DUF3631 domain-containing protein [Acidobacteriota bacterium]
MALLGRNVHLVPRVALRASASLAVAGPRSRRVLPGSGSTTHAARSVVPVPDTADDSADATWTRRIAEAMAIADLVGGDWPERARKAAMVLSGSDDVLEERVGPQLLADLRAVFGTRTELWTKDILTALHALPERPWGEWTSGKGSAPRPMSARTLAQLLRPYRIKSQQIRIGSENNNSMRRRQTFGKWRLRKRKGRKRP